MKTALDVRLATTPLETIDTGKLEILPAESKLLAELHADEAIVRKANALLEDGAFALKRIIDRKSYRAAGYRKFSAYAQATWGYSVAYVYRLISAARIARALRGEMPHLPLCESQIRKLTPLVVLSKENDEVDCTEAVKVVKELEETVGSSKITAKLIETEVARHITIPRRKMVPLTRARTKTLLPNVNEAYRANQVVQKLIERIEDRIKGWKAVLSHERTSFGASLQRIKAELAAAQKNLQDAGAEPPSPEHASTVNYSYSS